MEKKSQENKVFTFIKKQAFGLIISGLIIVWTFVKDTFNTGAELKMKQTIVKVVIESEDVDKHNRVIISEEIKKALNDPIIWLDVLSSDFVGGYTKERVNEVTTEFNKKIQEVDSMQQSMVNSVGRFSGLRNDQFEQILGEMMRDYIKKQKPHTVTAAF